MSTSLPKAAEDFLVKMVAGSMSGFEQRSCQTDMMRLCCHVLEEGGTLMAEAGTGTGKTFAYLIPLILSGKKAVISTRTINLQEQLARKDLKFLSTLVDIDYAVAKGRSNYLCLRRMNTFRPDDEEESRDIRGVLQWAAETLSGDLEDYGSLRLAVWDRVCADPDTCKWKRCGFYGQCFYFSARRRWAAAQIIVANHALVAVNAIMHEEAKLFPDAEVLVFDEAHAIDNAITDQIGIRVTNRSFDYILNKLLRVGEKGTYKGVLSQTPALFPAVESLRSEAELFWTRLRREAKDQQLIRGEFAQKDALTALANSINELVENMKASAAGLFEEDDELELKGAMIKLVSLADDLVAFPELRADHVRWVEFDEKRTAIRMSPVYPRAFMMRDILPHHETTIFTSATLSIGNDFSFHEQILGLDGCRKAIFPSPFDMAAQTTVEIRRGIDLRSSPDSIQKLADVIIEEAARRDGGMLVLFTSRDVMRRTRDAAEPALKAMKIVPMMQGDGLQNSYMLEIMRESGNSVIFGLDSFWEGVDVRGDALRSLVITKLPFDVPTEPVTLARTEDIERRGGNPFMEYSLPRAVIKFRQGFGRLIRSGADTGRVIICDDRVETKRYGRQFLDSIGIAQTRPDKYTRRR